MAELSLTCPAHSSGSVGSGAEVNLSNRTLVRTAGPFPADTALDLNNPGPGWVSSGDALTISGAGDFIAATQFYRNGQLLLCGESASSNNDVYFISSTATVGFEHLIQKNDILQIWKFTTASGS